MKTILCFGDSNTYGYIPDGSGRFPIEVRWTGRLQSALGDSARVIEEGLCGRTTIFPDKVRDGRRGIDMIGTLVESHYPVDLLVVMLGTNDCKSAYHATAEQITEGVCRVIERAKEHAPESMKALLISPIHLGKGVGEDGFDPEFDENSEHVAKKLAENYRHLAETEGYAFLNAAKYADPSETDREHLDQTGHQKLGAAIERKIREILEEDVPSPEEKSRENASEKVA